MDHFNQLTPAEAERVALLLEECGEVVQICGKILRHGFNSHNPHGGGPDNRNLLQEELGDIMAAKHLMNMAGDIADCTVEAHRVLKLRKVGKYLHHQD